MCHFRFARKARFIPWDLFISLTVTPGGPSDLSKYHDLDDIVCFKDERKKEKEDFFIIHWTIAVAVREKYYEMMGRYPPKFSWERTDTSTSTSSA